MEAVNEVDANGVASEPAKGNETTLSCTESENTTQSLKLPSSACTETIEIQEAPEKVDVCEGKKDENVPNQVDRDEVTLAQNPNDDQECVDVLTQAKEVTASPLATDKQVTVHGLSETDTCVQPVDPSKESTESSEIDLVPERVTGKKDTQIELPGTPTKQVDGTEIEPTATPQEADEMSSPHETVVLNSPEDQSNAQQSTTGLSLLRAYYISDSDSDDVCEVPTSHQNYQNRVVEIDSDSVSSESDVECSSSRRSSVDLSAIEASLVEAENEENSRNVRPPKVKGEFDLNDLPPIEDLHISVPAEECTELGQIQSIIEQLVVINSIPGSVLLDLDTVLFLEEGKQVLGKIFDVLGQVSEPMYCVRFNSNKEIIEKGIQVGQKVYVAPKTEHTQFIVLANVMKVRGSDASWEHDIEPPEKYLDYSDDEEERTARRSIRNKNRPVDPDEEMPKRPRTFDPNHNPHRPHYQSARPYRPFHAPHIRQPFYPSPGNYNIDGNSWHSNYYQNYGYPQYPQGQYQIPMQSPVGYGTPPYRMPNGGTVLPPPPPGTVVNPYAIYPPPQAIYQHPPPSLTRPPPPPPPQM